MSIKIDIVKNTISELHFVKQLYFIKQSEAWIVGKVEIAFEGLKNPLDFEFKISFQYPLKSCDAETIIFINKDLVAYNHVMSDGSICMHTSHNINYKEKLIIDFDSLKNWIIKYYLNKENDKNYEHIVINSSSIDDKHYAYFFTNCEDSFSKGEYGLVHLFPLNQGVYQNKTILNFLIQGFVPSLKNKKDCQWSNFYRNHNTICNGAYYFTEKVPALHGKFAFSNFTELSKLLSTDFLDFIHRIEKSNIKKQNGFVFPLFLGYKISGKEIHWQVILLQIGNFPLVGSVQKINERKTSLWHSELIDEKINWGLTRNCSYEYFFGRGVFSDELTKKKILIVGIGAIGSMIARTLTRCGCRYIDYVDYDVKEPENICRSEYNIVNGITNKTEELYRILNEISPFINSKQLCNNYFEFIIKSFYDDKEYRREFVQNLNSYDLILDCSTDNDLMYVLDLLKLNTEIMNISITNHANEMVCAFYPNIYKFVNHQFSNVLENDITDLYEPTGCWSTTFKASYNDINILVQLALKHLNKLIIEKKQKNNFVIKEINNTFKIIEF